MTDRPCTKAVLEPRLCDGCGYRIRPGALTIAFPHLSAEACNDSCARTVGGQTPLEIKVAQARRKDFYAGTWWDENGEAAWFPTERWSAWEAIAGFAYYLADGDLDFGENIELVGKVTLHPDCEPGGEPVDDRHKEVDPVNYSPVDTVEVWKVQIG